MVYRKSSGNVQTLLDVGCNVGYHIQELKRYGPKFRDAYLVGVDIWLPYLTAARGVFHDVIRCDIRRLPFQPSSFDVTVATDVLEHMEKGEGYELLKSIEGIARDQTFVFTPVGHNVKKHLEDDNPWQAHRSGWFTSELETMGYDVLGLNGVRFLYKERATYRSSAPYLRPFFVAMRFFSAFLTYHLPEGAHRMLAVKTKFAERPRPSLVFQMRV